MAAATSFRRAVDSGGLEAGLALLHPDVELRSPGVRRALLAAAAGIVLLTGACGGSDTVDGVASEGTATGGPSPSEEVVCFSGSYEPAEEGEVVPRDEACPEDAPSALPGSTESDSEAQGDLAAALLTPEEAARAEPESWRYGNEEPSPGPLLDPCDQRVFPRAEDLRASDEIALRWDREEAGGVLRQEVFRYRSAGAAEQALAEYAERVQRCPMRPWPDDPNGSGTRFEVVDRQQEGGGTQLLVRSTACNPGCIAHFRGYLGVAQQAELLTVVTYDLTLDGDPRQIASAVLRQAAQGLAPS